MLKSDNKIFYSFFKKKTQLFYMWTILDEKCFVSTLVHHETSKN